MNNLPMEFSYSDFSKFVDKCKSLKSKYVCIGNGNIYGIEFGEFYALKFISDDPIAQSLSLALPIYEVSEIVASLGELTKGSSVTLEKHPIWNICLKVGDTIVTHIYNSTAFSILSNILTNFNVSTYTQGCFIDNIKTHEVFCDIVNMKTADGSTLAIVDGKYPITYFSKLLSFTKADTISLNIYEMDDVSFLTVFTVNKKKFKINTVCRYKYLKRRV